MAKRIDLGKGNIGKLFSAYFFPTLLSMMFSAAFNLADGIFVGRGVGSDALAAVNVAAPMFMIATGVGLMLGGGASVIGAINLSRGNKLDAGVCSSQALLSTLVFGALIGIIVIAAPGQLCYIFGGSDVLRPYVGDYLRGLSVGLISDSVMICGMFVIRLDGSPRYAMMSNVIPSLLNVGLDYWFIFPLGWGIAGAAWVTSISTAVGALMVGAYFLFFAKDVRLRRLRLGKRNVWLGLNSILKMSKIGVPALIGDLAISFMLVIGNYMFIGMLGEDGVAAFSVACYLTPMLFMFANAIAQSSMPIVSFNHGCGQDGRVRRTLRLSLTVAAASGLFVTLCMSTLSHALSASFLGSATNAFRLADKGLPLFASGAIFLIFNIVLIGYLQSVEQSKSATLFMVLRGFVFVALFSQVLPRLLGEAGLWLTVPAAEFMAFLTIAITLTRQRRKGRVAKDWPSKKREKA